MLYMADADEGNIVSQFTLKLTKNEQWTIYQPQNVQI